MRLPRIAFCPIILFLMVCINHESSACLKIRPLTDTILKSYDKILAELEQKAAERNTDSLGTLLNEINFKIKTTNLADYEEGFIPHIELDQPKANLLNLVDKDQIVITDNKIIVIIDYPLTNECRFTLISKTGFTREQLVTAISDQYHKLYREEEATATVKTIPINERTTLYNRNQTNGKYGIWGHDIADLVLVNILVYKSPDGMILLSLNIES